MGPGDVIAQRYRLERLLGKGGMGSVWAARHTVTGKAFALKLLHATGDDASARRRMLREARAACAALHPSILAVHDVLEADDGSPVLVMDLLEGESLRARLARERVLPLDEALRIVRAVLGGLEAAHAAGIVHRDLKPDNLFLLDGGEVKILDFGVAKVVAPEGVPGASGALTATGAMIGTPYYMAPEQAFGDPIDARADLWAVGVILYECLAGAPPTQAENLGQVLRLLTNGKLEPLAARVPTTPEPVARLVGELLSIDPADRPGTAREVLEALAGAPSAEAGAPEGPAAPARFLSAAPTPNPSGETTGGAAGSPRPRSRVAVAAAGVVAAVALGVLAFGKPASPSPDAATSAVVATAPPEPAEPAPSAVVSAREPAANAASSTSASPSTPSGAPTVPPASTARADRAIPPQPPAKTPPAPAPTASAASANATAAPPASSDAAPTKLLTKVPF